MPVDHLPRTEYNFRTKRKFPFATKEVHAAGNKPWIGWMSSFKSRRTREKGRVRKGGAHDRFIPALSCQCVPGAQGVKTRRGRERKRGSTVGTTSREAKGREGKGRLLHLSTYSLLYILLLAVNSTDLHKETATLTPRLFSSLLSRENRGEKK